MSCYTSFDLLEKLERWLLCMVIAAFLIYGANATICKLFSIPPDWIVSLKYEFSHR
jgi:hypothetical protein